MCDKFKHANEVHIVPDRYDIEDSIKAGERGRRAKKSAIKIIIQNHQTKLPVSLKLYLSSGKNKSNLLLFLVSDWSASPPGSLDDTVECLCTASILPNTIP